MCTRKEFLKNVPGILANIPEFKCGTGNAGNVFFPWTFFEILDSPFYAFSCEEIMFGFVHLIQLCHSSASSVSFPF